MKIEIRTRLNELETLRADWDALASCDRRDGFFRTAGWVIPWLRFIRPQAQPFVIMVKSDTDELIGIAPLCLTKFVDLAVPLRGLGFAGREVVSGDYLDIITSPQNRATVYQTAFVSIWSSRAKWDVLQLGELVEGSELQQVSTSWASHKKLNFRYQEHRVCPYIELPDSFEKYLEGLSSSVRYQIRRRKRDLLEKNGCTIRVCSNARQIEEGLNVMIDLHVRRWQRDRQPGTLTRPGFPEFLKEVCINPPAGAACRLYILGREDNIVGALLAFHYGDSALYYQAGWDPSSDLSRLSPGMVMMAHAIEDAILCGKKYYDFLRGDESYKSQWTKTSRKSATLIVGRSLRGSGYVKVANLKDQAKLLFGKSETGNVGEDRASETQA